MSKSKFRLVLLFLILLSFITIASILFFKYYQLNQYNKDSKYFINSVKNKIQEYPESKTIPENINTYLSVITNNKKSDKERYDALNKLAFTFSLKYAVTNDPSLRKFSAAIIGPYAQKHFHKQYNEADFNFPCQDQECGGKINPEVTQIINGIKNNNQIPDYMKDTILINLKGAIYEPVDSFGLKLSVQQLREVGENKASQSAEKIIKFSKERYKIKI